MKLIKLFTINFLLSLCIVLTISDHGPSRLIGRLLSDEFDECTAFDDVNCMADCQHPDINGKCGPRKCGDGFTSSCGNSLTEDCNLPCSKYNECIEGEDHCIYVDSDYPNYQCDQGFVPGCIYFPYLTENCDKNCVEEIGHECPGNDKNCHSDENGVRKCDAHYETGCWYKSMPLQEACYQNCIEVKYDQCPHSDENCHYDSIDEKYECDRDNHFVSYCWYGNLLEEACSYNCLSCEDIIYDC